MTDPVDDDAIGAVVLPVGPERQQSADDDALEMFARGEGLLISWSPAMSGTSRKQWSDASVSASSSLGKSLNQVYGTAARSASRGLGTAEPLFRVELPPGQTLDNLVSAVGGGYRGITKSAESSKIIGHVRLQRVAGVGVGAGAGIALGPLVGLIALGVASEMIAQRQMNKKLDAIHNAVDDVRRHLTEQDDAILPLAEKTLSQVTAYLLDRVDIPAVAGVGNIFADLAKYLQVRLDGLAAWERTATWAEEKERKDRKVDAPELMKRLAGTNEQSVQRFARRVEETYRALALQARVASLKRIEVAVRRPDADLTHVEAAVTRELATITADQDRLRDVLGRLAGLRLTNGFFSTPGTDRTTIDARTILAQLAFKMAVAPAAVPVLSADHRPVVELQRRPDGSFSVLEPVL